MRPVSRLLGGRAAVAALGGAAMLLGVSAQAAEPRWTVGSPYYQSNGGNPVVWYTTQPMYYTDPGDLSASVNHAAADALVAAAAATWNVSASSITLAQGGTLNEHVSGANVYMGSSGPVFPSDVQASNSAAKPIAVIYDSDGSVTDTLLGGGASDPGNCRQSAVTESVDSIATSGQIMHALIVLNGRCTGSAPALQQEMKYRLIRAFGRVLGLGWSQLNDNVFTGLPQPTTQQGLNWPIMHPIDLLCGPYAYQCMLQPFTLRTDDIASLVNLYPVSSTGNGKTASYSNAASVIGFLSFPNGQGMEGALVSVRRFHFGPGYTDAFDVASNVTGSYFQQTAGNPVAPKTSSFSTSSGSSNTFLESFYWLAWIPIPGTDYFDNLTVTTSTVNPLYTGQYAVGPYVVSQVTPSGTPVTATASVVNAGYTNIGLNMTAANASATCASGSDGTEGVPLSVASSGSWSDTMCGYQHTAWSGLAVKAGRSLTMEVTAVDEQGYATTGKMLPVMGVWDSGDATGSPPTLASQAAALNASTLGMTNMRVATVTARTLRISLSDMRGDGRPDYGYNARVFYADSVSPASLPANGGVVTISGMGFHPGNTVTVNGIAAHVTNWTANAISLEAPAITGPLSADVVVDDLSTGAESTMSGALTYSQTSLPDVLSVVSKPADGGYVGSVGSPVFQVLVMLPDGVTPASGVGVTFSSAKATFGSCAGASTCVVTTDASGMVSSPVTPTSAGTVTLTATVGPSSISSTFIALAIPVDGLSVTSLPSGTVYATLPAAAPFTVKVTLPDGTTAAAGAHVAVTATNAALAACSGASTCTLIADGSGVVSTTVTPATAGVVSLLATAGGGTVSASFGATTLPGDVLHVVSKPADGSYVGRSASVPLTLQVMLGDNATPAPGVAVTVTATGATLGACGASTCALTADGTGTVATTVTPTAAGTVGLTVTAGGGSLSTSFNAVVVPPDTLHTVSKPADGTYVGRTTAIPFSVQVFLGDTGGPAAGISVNVSATNATLGFCGAASCVMTADSTGTISTTLVPIAAGSVVMTASAGGGTLSVSFVAAAIPPDTLTALTKPADGSYVGRVAAIPFAVQVALGDTGGPATGVGVVVSASNATLGACGAASCTLTADSTGTISTTVTPASVGAVSLSASAGGGTVSSSFNAVAVPPDALHVVTKPADGSYVGRVAAIPFAVQVALGDTGAPATGVSVSVSATNATLTACGASTCSIVADSSGTVSTTVTPSTVGSVGLTASAGGGTVSASFLAVAIPPDSLNVLTRPADGSYVGRVAALPFSVQIFDGETGSPAAGVTVTVTAVGATLAGCAGASTCAMTADAMGKISTSVTPSASGTVSLTASAGGGTVSATFSAVVVPPDALHVVTQPADGSYVARVAPIPFAVQAALGDTGGPAIGVSVIVSTTNAVLGACGAATCTLIADSAGSVSTTVTPSAVGAVHLTAGAGGGSVSVTFNAVAVPPDTLNLVTKPADGSYVGRSAALPFAAQVLLGDTGAAASGVSVTVSATNATLAACGGTLSCVLTADSTGSISTAVTPSAVGAVGLTASAGGGTLSVSFNAVAVPPDALHVVSQPANGSYIGRAATVSFAVQVALGDTGGPAAGVSVAVSATNAILNACGASTCTMTADSAGTISTTVTPSAAGSVGLTASAGGGTVSVSFTAVVVPPDALSVVAQPANGAYAGRAAALPFTVQVALGDTGGPASGVSISVSATNATLGACAAATCSVTADSTGTISTTVTPSAVGAVSLSASAGGGTVSATFNAVAVPPDSLHVVTRPAYGSYVGRASAIPLVIQVALGDTGGPAAGVAVSVSASNATLAACGAATCTLTADSTGTISTTVTPSAVGTVSLSASAGGGTVSATFNAVAVPPDSLHVLTKPVDGSYVGRAAGLPFAVQVVLGDTGAPAAGVSVSVSATNATLAACGGVTCTLTADPAGAISTTVTPSAAGSVGLTASAGGGTVSASFTAVAVPPNALSVVTQPVNGAYAGRAAALPFTVQVVLGDTGGPASGASVSVSATNATLGACGAATCTLTADATGTISTAVTPSAVGVVSLSASAGGGTVSTTFNAVAVPPDALHVVTKPADGSYAGRVAALPFTVQVALGDTGGPAAGVSVSVSATNATLGACGSATCTLIADATGTISTTVTPSAVGAVSLSASAGGGTVSAPFNAVAVPPDALHVVTKPADGSYAGRVAALPFTVQVALGDTGGPAYGVGVTVSASNATLAACGGATCTLTADSTGTISTTVTPSAAGLVTLSASAGGGTVSATFNAVAVPPDTLHLATKPADGSYVGRAAVIPFAAQVLLGDTGGPASGVSVTISATNATLAICGGASSCVVSADSTGTISTGVTPLSAGAVGLTASAGGGTLSATFNAVAVPPDALHVVTQPANGSYAGRAAVLPFAVQVALGDTGGPASGVSVTVSATNATLNSCGASTCTITADLTGTISTTVTPAAVGPAGLTASAGGGTVSVSFNAVAVPPDTLHVLTQPANGSYTGTPAAILFSVQTLLGDTGGVASGANVTLTATNATLGCGGSSCTLAAGLTGTVSTTVTPSAPGTVGLSASAGGGTASTSFSAVAMPPDTLQIVSQPANGTYPGSPAVIPFLVSVLLGDGITPATGVPVTVSAAGATLGACGLSTCTITADALGAISTTVTALAPGVVTLGASAGGGLVSTTFTASSIPDTLQVLSAPSDHTFINQVAATPYVVQATLGVLTNSRLKALAARGGTPAAGEIITLSAGGARLNACGLPVCVLTADSTGTVSTTVTPILPGPVTLLASGGGASASTVFAADTPPDILHVTSAPANGAYANRVAASPFGVQVLLGDGTTPAAGVSVTLTASGATLGACGLGTCVVPADGSGNASSAVTPNAPGTVQLTATAGGGTTSASFTAAAVPPDSLHVVTQPANGSYVGRPATVPFSVQTLLGDTGGPAAGASVTLSAVNATLGACGLSTCVLTADSTGSVSTSVNPSTAGTVQLTATAGGGTISASFNAVAVPPDSVQVLSQPANGSYAGRVAAAAFTVQVLLGDTGGPAAGVSVTVTSTGATLGACGASTCALTADSTGTVSTTVTPSTPGPVGLSAMAGGGAATTSFTAAAVPPDSLHIVTKPANGSYSERTASVPFTVQVLLGDTGGPASGASVTLSSTNATLSACGASTCILTADATGTVSTSVTPASTGTVPLTATAGGGSVATSFTAVAVPPDTLHVQSQPANGAYVARVAATPFTVQVLLGDTGGAAAGAQVTLAAVGASLTACGASSCLLTADSNGTVSTTVSPSAPGTVQLNAAAGGGTVSASFTAAAVPPDSLQVLSQPADGSYVGSPAAIRFAVKALLGDTGGPAAGAGITVTAANATLGACGASTCALTADSTGTVSTAVTPLAPGPVSLTAAVGGGTVSTSFNAAPAPVDALHILSQPSGTVYTGVPAPTSFAVQVMLPDGTTPASGAAVTLAATRAVLASCGASSCILTADASGVVSTSVIPLQPGVVTLQASAGGGVIATTFTAVALPADIVSVVSAPSGPVYLGIVAATRFAVHVLLGDGVTPASAAQVTLTAAGASLGACNAASCILTADASGDVSSTVTPSVAGAVSLTASAGGGAASTSFNVTPDVLRVVASPANGSYTGSPAAASFSVQVSLGDGSTPAPGVAVSVASTGATLGACALATCTLTADSLGIVSTTVTATASGTVTLAASAGGGAVSTSFAAVAPPDIVQVLSSPANGSYINRSSTTPFAVQVSVGNASNRVAGLLAAPNVALPPASGVAVTLSATGATLDACGLASCSLTTDLAGTVSTTVTPTTLGPIALSASAGGGTVSSSFTAAPLPDVLRVVSVPANGTYFGRAAAAPFTVHVLQGDGVTPAAGVSVTVTAAGATLGECGRASCVMSSDAGGAISTTVTPAAAGTISLTASAGGGAVSASFTSVAPPDILHVVSAPANGAYTGRPASVPFTVQVLLGDGVTAAAGATVTLTSINAIFNACGLATCTATADATGIVSTTVTPVLAGTVTLTAQASGGAVSATFTSVDPVRTIGLARTTEYVAAGAIVPWTQVVTLLENGLPAPGVAVAWTTGPASGIALAAPVSTTDAAGTANLGVTIGPLASGVVATATACAWANVCATFGAQALDPSTWRLVPVDGATQTVQANGTLQPLVVRAVDDAGDWIAGVAVQIHQVVRGWVACPPTGRCPVGPVLSTATSTIVSDADGLASITPLQVANSAEATQIVAVAGPSGYLSISISKVP